MCKVKGQGDTWLTPSAADNFVLLYSICVVKTKAQEHIYGAAVLTTCFYHITFIAIQVLKKAIEKGRELFVAFTDLEKAWQSE